MIPRHHLPDDVLMAHASGVSAPAIEVLVSAHLVLCPDCRRQTAEYEAVGGAALSRQDPAPVDASVLDSIMDQLDTGMPPERNPAPDTSSVEQDLLDGGLILPRPILELVAQTAGRWKAVVPGLIHEIFLPLTHGEMPVRLIRMRGGFEVPPHTHDGTEINLVLAGGYNDDEVEFERGDVQFSDESVTHSLKIHKEAPCVLLVVNESPLVPVGAKSRLAQLFTGKM